MPALTSKAVTDIMTKVLFKKDEEHEDFVAVHGLVNNYGFHPVRVREAKPEIDALLSELPKQFYRSGGGGWSFLNAAEDKDGNLWGQHRDMESLVCLGIAVGSASWIMKDMASALPGGVPYFEIHPGEE